jgi:hypothetical protein
MLAHPPLSSRAQPVAELRVPDQSTDGSGEASGVVWRNEDTCFAVPNELRHAGNCRRDAR